MSGYGRSKAEGRIADIDVEGGMHNGMSVVTPSSTDYFRQKYLKTHPATCLNHIGTGIVWTCNLALIVVTVIALINWTAVTWIIGNVGWAAVLEVVCILLVLYMLLAGCCVIGFRDRIYESYMHLHDSKQCLYISAIGMPLAIIIVFTLLAALSLSNAANIHVQQHAEDIFQQADTVQPFGELSPLEFRYYFLSLPAFKNKQNDTKFLENIQTVFDTMDEYDHGYLIADDMYRGVMKTVWPYQQRFGIAVSFIAIICTILIVVYWIAFYQLKKQKVEQMINKRMEPERLPFID